MNSCIYSGIVRHRRFTPVEHSFQYRMFQLYLDLDELPGVLDPFACWSARGPALAWFRRADHFGDPARSLASCVRDQIEQQTGRRPAGPIRMLTNLRYFGYVINPVSYFYCFDPETDSLQTVLAEVHNTPWGEQHCYVVDKPTRPDNGAPVSRWTPKAFHVSPFMPMEMQYRWRISTPGDRLSVNLQNHVTTDREESSLDDDATSNGSTGRKQSFDVTMHLRKQPLTTLNLSRVLLRHPLMTSKVVAAIYWQALRLWAKGVPFVPHPSKRPPADRPLCLNAQDTSSC